MGTEQRYFTRFNSFFNNEKLSSTYKPVFVKSHTDISDYDEQNPQRLIGQQQWIEREKDDKLRFDLNFIAIRYIQHYWELYFKFKLKQSQNPQDANINRVLRKVQNEHDPKTPSLKSLRSRSLTTDITMYSIFL